LPLLLSFRKIQQGARPAVNAEGLLVGDGPAAPGQAVERIVDSITTAVSKARLVPKI